MNVADPVAGGVVSVIVRDVPLDVVKRDSVQLLPSTDHVIDVAAQLGVPEAQTAFDGELQEPPLQVNDAEPVFGLTESINVIVEPAAVSGANALQALPFWLHVRSVELQGGSSGGVVQVPSSSTNVPAVQRKFAAPVVGGVESVTMARPPSVVAGAEALHALSFSDHATADAAQSPLGGGVGVGIAVHTI